MKKGFFKTRIGSAIFSGLTAMIILAIVSPVFDLIFGGGIKEFNVSKYVIEPILVGVGVGILDYVFRITEKRQNNKKD